MYRTAWILFNDFMNGRYWRDGRFPDPTQVLKQNQNKQDIGMMDDATINALGFSMPFPVHNRKDKKNKKWTPHHNESVVHISALLACPSIQSSRSTTEIK